jgi:DNA-binding GntR family transcriptional regulator
VSTRPTAWGAYAQIADVLRARIAGGELARGSLLPSEAALCAEFAVVRDTARRALAVLERDGLIMTLPGKGRVVQGDVPAQYEYRRIADELRREIETGNLRPGDVLPSEAAIVDRYGVARGTARQAFTELDKAGLIETRHGKGRFVRRRP